MDSGQRSEVGGIKWNMFSLPWAVGFNVTTVNDMKLRERLAEPLSNSCKLFLRKSVPQDLL